MEDNVRALLTAAKEYITPEDRFVYGVLARLDTHVLTGFFSDTLHSWAREGKKPAVCALGAVEYCAARDNHTAEDRRAARDVLNATAVTHFDDVVFGLQHKDVLAAYEKTLAT